jgi:hypothetical protein
MTTNLASATADNWLTPRDTYLLLALTGPPPADVHRDLASILHAAAAYAHPWQPVPAPPDTGPASPGHDPLASAAATPPQSRPSPNPVRSWFQRGPLRPRTQS